jgi:hypothetical protein
MNGREWTGLFLIVIIIIYVAALFSMWLEDEL